MKNKRMILGALVGLVLLSGACATTKVSRMDANKEMDISGRWNDTDSRLVSEEMIKDCLGARWLVTFGEKNKGKQPDVLVGKVKNKSHEHIAVETFIKDLERTLTNDGRVAFVAGGSTREDIRAERADQAGHADEESVKGPGHEAGADFMLAGSINTIVDQEGGKSVVFYQIDLELTDMATNRKVWLGQKKIKKFVEKGSVTY